MTTDQITAASNGAWIGAALLVCILVIRGLLLARTHHRAMGREALNLCIGALCTSMGVIIHRGYWNLSIFARNSGDAYADWSMDARYIPSVAVLFIVMGAVVATSSYGIIYFGRRQWLLVVCVVFALLAGGSAYMAA